MAKEQVNFALIFGLGAAGLALWYILSGRASKGTGEVAELAAQLRAQDPTLSQAEALALAAAQIAQQSVNQAQNAADTAAVDTHAGAYQDAETQNQAAQEAASIAPTDTSAAQAATAAQAEADRKRAELEASFAAQLSTAESAAQTAKGALATAFSSWQAAYKVYTDYQAYIAARMANTGMNIVNLWKDSNQSGTVRSFKLGTTNLAGTGMDNEATSWSGYQGFKFRLFQYKDCGGDVFGPIYMDKPANQGNLTGFNDKASCIKIEPYPQAYAPALGDKLAAADRIKLEVTNCQTALNSCIERVQSIIDQIRTYNVLSSRISTSASSLQALRSYVASIKVS